MPWKTWMDDDIEDVLGFDPEDWERYSDEEFDEDAEDEDEILYHDFSGGPHSTLTGVFRHILADLGFDERVTETAIERWRGYYRSYSVLHDPKDVIYELTVPAVTISSGDWYVRPRNTVFTFRPADEMERKWIFDNYERIGWRQKKEAWYTETQEDRDLLYEVMSTLVSEREIIRFDRARSEELNETELAVFFIFLAEHVLHHRADPFSWRDVSEEDVCRENDREPEDLSWVRSHEIPVSRTNAKEYFQGLEQRAMTWNQAQKILELDSDLKVSCPQPGARKKSLLNQFENKDLSGSDSRKK